ncbi:octicosapeptide/Phox/Bem1p (PB1) domain-containing protein [Actinidia rufa]|uniref:Octicosapeptide/Phox/Bem1p (PB1) domain-containing protein n=1 Tax=Actinidia rufa TaxID=165716 RepID=A0A7J0EZ37_9ERIC|nr:octicosapeptide/Phox/Bem1p (PB1) domain-containing protein [Actinidia rufa]
MGKSGGKKKKGGVNQNQKQNQVSGANNSPIPNTNGGVDLDSSIFLKRAHELKEEGNRRFQAKDYVGSAPICVRALLRRARAFEATGKYEMAMQDVQVLLGTDPNHGDALEIARRLRTALGPHQEAQQDLQSRPSPAALGASAVRGAPISGLGPCLPARPVPKKAAASAVGSVALPNNKPDKPQPVPPAENGPDVKTHFPNLVLKPSNGSTKSRGTKDNLKEHTSSSVLLATHSPVLESAVKWRPLKLVYDHDIRLGQMPVHCNFRVLREIVSKRFPSSKSVLIKYKDNDGDLVTITCTNELRLAESFVDSLIPKEPETDKIDSIGILRLHIVDVSPEQEPPILKEGEEEEKSLESEGIKEDESGSNSSLGDSDVETVKTDKPEKEAPKEKPGTSEDPECKEVEIDDWLFEFAQLFRTHVGIDPDAHIDLHEIGMELCSEALEDSVTSEEAQSLFDKAALKFQEVVALAFFNWGNVHMCAARKRIPIDDSAAKELVAKQLQAAYDWVREKYSLAKEKYEEALLIKPDFYEGLLALGQQQFEMAKLHWSYVLAKKEDLANWDPTETIKLFDSAEEKMKTATEMWEKMEEQRANELKDPSISADEAAEQAAMMRSQIHLFWGNMLFERSQVEFKLGLAVWKKNLDDAVERFKLAGASEVDISTVLKTITPMVMLSKWMRRRLGT